MRYFTSDLHFGHKAVIDFCRPQFGSVNEMNETIVDRWNSRITKNDQVWVLGDVSFCDTEQTRVLLGRLFGQKCLVMGNHDWKWGTRKWHDLGFAKVYQLWQKTLGGQSVMMSHFPYTGDHMKERYLEHRPRDLGHWLLHGHVHEHWKIRKKQINVGVDQWDMTPVSENQILEVIHADHS